MKLGYDLTIEQTQKLVMTPELIQAIKILQFNTQELDTFVQDQLLTNPVLESSAEHEEANEGEEHFRREEERSRRDEPDWEEYIRGSYTEAETVSGTGSGSRERTTRATSLSATWTTT